MYGMVNQAVKDLVVAKFGSEKWDKICADIKQPTDDFVFMDYYPDKLTYDLVFSASKNLQLSPEIILREFGKHWVLYTAKEGYGPMMDMFGTNFKDCLKNLNNLHARMGMTMPQITPPSFYAKEVSENIIHFEYHSKREGLAPMVEGLILGLAEKYKVQVKITLLQTKESHKLFEIDIAG